MSVIVSHYSFSGTSPLFPDIIRGKASHIRPTLFYQRLPNLNTGVPLDVIFIADNIFDGTSARTTAGCACKGKREDAPLPVALGTCSAAAVFGPTAQQFGADAAGFGPTAQQFGVDAAGFIWPAQQPWMGAAA
jgi:hypothetical protein